MQAAVILAQEATNPILRGSNEAVWAVLSVMSFVAVAVAVILVGKYFIGLRREVVALEGQVRALRDELRGGL